MTTDPIYLNDIISVVDPLRIYHLEVDIKCVYLIENPKGKIYIGKTIDLRRRLRHYIGLHFKEKNLLYHSLSKYGFENHKITILHRSTTEKEITDKECFFIKKYKTNIKKHRELGLGLNMTDGGDGMSGYKYSEESRIKMSMAKKGVFSGSKNPNFGKKHSERTRELISKARKGRKASEETKLKLSRSSKLMWAKNRDKMMQMFTPEFRKNLSDKAKQRIISEETRLKMSQNSARNKSKLVLDFNTGVYYYSCKEAAIALGHVQSTLRSRLNGFFRNNTSLRYV